MNLVIEALRMRRRQLHITQRQVGMDLGVTPQNISQLESSGRGHSMDKVIQYADYLDVHVRALLKGSIVICVHCRHQDHHKCAGFTWCDCQHRSIQQQLEEEEALQELARQAQTMQLELEEE